MHTLGAERIDGDTQGQGRIDAPGEPQDHPRKAVLVDIVARPLHQGAIDALLLALQRHDLARQRLDPTGTALEIHHIHPFGECRRAHGHLTGCIHDEGISVKHQLILTAEQVDEYQRDPRLRYARARDLSLALRLLVHLVGRGVDHQQHLGACTPCSRRGPGRPNVLANQNTRLDAVDSDHRGVGTGREVALLVEYAVIRQIRLAVIGQHHAVANHDGGIVDAPTLVFRIARDQSDTAYFGLEPVDRAGHLQAHTRVEQQILGRIPGYGKLGHHHDVGSRLIARLVRRGNDAQGVPLDIADDQIELRQGAAKLPWIAQSVPSPKIGLCMFSPSVPIWSHRGALF